MLCVKKHYLQRGPYSSAEGQRASMPQKAEELWHVGRNVHEEFIQTNSRPTSGNCHPKPWVLSFSVSISLSHGALHLSFWYQAGSPCRNMLYSPGWTNPDNVLHHGAQYSPTSIIGYVGMHHPFWPGHPPGLPFSSLVSPSEAVIAPVHDLSTCWMLNKYWVPT